MDLVNVCERAFSFLNIPAVFVPKRDGALSTNLLPADWPGCHPLEQYFLRIMGQMGGLIFSLHPAFLKNFKIKGQGAVMLADLSTLEKKTIGTKKKYKPLPKFPSSTFDYCLEVEKERPVGDILACLKKINLKEFLSHSVVDVYGSEGPLKYVTLRSVFADKSRTLSGDFLKEAKERIISTLEAGGFPLKKGEGGERQ